MALKIIKKGATPASPETTAPKLKSLVLRKPVAEIIPPPAKAHDPDGPHPDGYFREKGEPVDPAFKKWYADAFQKELLTVTVPGMPFATWDRKAAWLLWQERQK